MGTQAAEIELGHTINEPVNYAVRAAIEQAVVEMIKEGDRKKYWKMAVRPETIIKEIVDESASSVEKTEDN